MTRDDDDDLKRENGTAFLGRSPKCFSNVLKTAGGLLEMYLLFWPLKSARGLP